jgi:hypothetical protein
VSKKRNKNARAKQVRHKKKDAPPREERVVSRPVSTAARDLDRQLEEDFVENEFAGADLPKGGGAFAKIRSSMNRQEEGPDSSSLYRRRGLGEWAVWFAVAGVVAYFFNKYYPVVSALWKDAP